MGGQGALVWEPVGAVSPFFPALQPLSWPLLDPTAARYLQAMHRVCKPSIPSLAFLSAPRKPRLLVELVPGFLLAVAN